MGLTLADVQDKLVAKSAELHEFSKAFVTEKKDAEGGMVFKEMTPEQLNEFQTRNAELETLESQFQTIHKAQKNFAEYKSVRFDSQGKEVPDNANERKTLGKLVTESKAFMNAFNRVGGAKPEDIRKLSLEFPGLDLKTTMSTGAGFAPANPRTDIVIPSAQRRPVVADLIAQGSTQSQVVKFMEETTFTNSVAAVAEGGAIPESALAYTERSCIVEKIATFLPVTDEQILFVDAMMNTIDGRMMLMLMIVEETQLLTANGTTPNIRGLNNATGIQTYAKTATQTPWDALYYAFTKVRYTGFTEPSGVVIHPNDWQDVRLGKTADGQYLFGSPAIGGLENVWGKPVVVTPSQTENTALVGNYAEMCHISRRGGIQVDVSDSHSDYFVNGKVAIRIQEWLSLEIYRGAAFCTVTSI